MTEANPAVQPPIFPDLPELRLLAQLAAVKPSALAAALNDLDHFSIHVSDAELLRYLAGAKRVTTLVAQISGILSTAVAKSQKAKGRHSNG